MIAHDLDPKFNSLQADVGLLEGLVDLSIKRGWKASTLATRLGTVAGCLRLLPIYCPQAAPIIMGQSVYWVHGTRGAQKRHNKELCRCATPGTWSTIAGLLDRFGDTDAVMLIALSFCCCARIGDTCRLRKGHITQMEDGLIITFRDGKTTMKRGPFSVPASLPPDPYKARLLNFLAKSTNPQAFLFSKGAYKETRVILRSVGLSQHSVRRGAVHALAKSGMTVAQMLLFTGHSSREGLLSYLDDGSLDPDIMRALTAGEVLFGGGEAHHHTTTSPETSVVFQEMTDPFFTSRETSNTYL